MSAEVWLWLCEARRRGRRRHGGEAGDGTTAGAPSPRRSGWGRRDGGGAVATEERLEAARRRGAVATEERLGAARRRGRRRHGGEAGGGTTAGRRRHGGEAGDGATARAPSPRRRGWGRRDGGGAVATEERLGTARRLGRRRHGGADGGGATAGAPSPRVDERDWIF